MAYRFVFPVAPEENSFVVVSPNSAFTVAVLSTGFTGEVRTMVVEKDDDRYLLTRLRRSARFIEKRQHNLFVAMDIRGRLDAVEQCYEVGEGVLVVLQTLSSPAPRQGPVSAGHSPS
ncbi:hypothetical protein [Rhizobium phaseoli]|uniref:hypothetical protein n=1 Tax=Rhizobium phaseoli TaxID=396 RepID=UPI0011AE76A2|nr:hypothetical protein [Rhizobium phaseoli]